MAGVRGALVAALVLLALCGAARGAGAAGGAPGAPAQELDCSRLPGCSECAAMTPEEWQAARKQWLAAKTAAASSKKAAPAAGRRLLAAPARANATHARAGKKGGDLFKPANRTPIKCIKCSGPEYMLQSFRCVCSPGFGWQLAKPVKSTPAIRNMPVCKKCPAGFASGPSAPEPSGAGLWAARRANRHGAVCVSCPSKVSSDDRTKCVNSKSSGGAP